MEIEKVTSSTYRLNDRTSKINVGVVVTPDGVLLVDTGSSLGMGREIKRLVGEVTSQPVSHVINTHNHREHVGGNAAFGALVIFHVSCYYHMLTRKEREEKERAVSDVDVKHLECEGSRALGKTPLSLPSVCFSDRGYLLLGGTFVEIYHTPGHTEGSILVSIPSEHVVIGGDTLSLDPLQIDGDSDLTRWAESIQLVRRLGPRQIIPGRSETIGFDGLDSIEEAIQLRLKGEPAEGRQAKFEEATGLIRISSKATRKGPSRRAPIRAKGASAR